MSQHHPPRDSSTGSVWQSIRPWTLALQIREITSVSATFILASPRSLTSDLSPASPPRISNVNAANLNRGSDSRVGKSISDVLGRGLAVQINGTSWHKLVFHIDDEADEAIIILYGLLPGRHYDIELEVVAGEGEERIRGQITTENGAEDPNGDDWDDEDDSDVDEPESLPSDGPADDILGDGDNDPTHHNQSPQSAPQLPHERPVSVDERAAQLRHTISLLNTEADSLTSQLKVARREAQRAEASLRSEIESQRRSSEKNNVSEQRSRQKVLALQEAVKQALAAASETEEQVRMLEESEPSYVAKVSEVEELHIKAKEEAKGSEERTEDAIKADKKKLVELQAELGLLGGRLEKVNGKKEKLEKESLPDLESQLAALIQEREELEKMNPQDEVEEFNHEANYPHHYAAGASALRQPVVSRPIQRPGPTNISKPPVTKAITSTSTKSTTPPSKNLPIKSTAPRMSLPSSIPSAHAPPFQPRNPPHFRHSGSFSLDGDTVPIYAPNGSPSATFPAFMSGGNATLSSNGGSQGFAPLPGRSIFPAPITNATNDASTSSARLMDSGNGRPKPPSTFAPIRILQRQESADRKLNTPLE